MARRLSLRSMRSWICWWRSRVRATSGRGRPCASSSPRGDVVRAGRTVRGSHRSARCRPTTRSTARQGCAAGARHWPLAGPVVHRRGGRTEGASMGAAEDPTSGCSRKPGGVGVCGAVCEDVDGAAGVHVDEDRCVGTPRARRTRRHPDTGQTPAAQRGAPQQPSRWGEDPVSVNHILSDRNLPTS